ncbi:YdcF family protein [Paucibacter sp. R3-3]|uniref:YdcF family protein n=1 Tax=Roseateles agri TaxID=3098619 RepID=A0ABU5DHR6_9BURK|nr:YdcF family protein [Paucibacter sp. R3-3]MDY0745834.1 YdcF family protein [Paucibacter sp. R3-3]
MNIADLVHGLKPLLLVLLLPPVPLMLLIALGGVLMLRRHMRWGMSMLMLGLLGLWLSCCEGSTRWLNRYLLDTPAALNARDLAALHRQQLATHDVAVLVLGAGVRDYVPEYMGPGLQPLTEERLRYGVWLARRLEAPLGFTGGIGWGARNKLFTEAALVERAARDQFDTPLRWAESRSRDTRENASLSLPLLKASGVRKLVLVTHVEHMPRALKNFHEAAQGANAMEIIAAPVGLMSNGTGAWLDWCPSGEGASGVRYVVYEWLGSLAGH